ncbi:MAG: thiolase family protein [Acidimicrobiales bacterium]|nr:thiolase family protein [Acidimicrobiales bacterium]
MVALGTGVAVTGVGISSDLGRNTGRNEGELAVQACRAAIADAGLDVAEIDGLSMFPHRTKPPNAFSGPDLPYVQRSLGIQHVSWYQASTAEHGQLGAVLHSIDALAAGRCTHVVCYRAHLAQNRRYLAGGDDPTKSYDEDEHTLPYGAGSGTARGALWAARYMARYGITQRELGSVNVNGRAYGSNNPDAYWKTPVTIEEYLDSRWIATPLKVLDCDYPIDGASAIVFSRADAARSTRAPVWIESTGCGPGPATTWVTWPEKSEMAARYAGERLWAQTNLKPGDVDNAEVYDGFSFFTLCWLEQLGLKPVGQAGAWLLEGGGQPGGDLAVNTDGGQLGMGRLHGFGKVVQATRQVRGEAVNQAPDVEVAIASAGGGPGAAALLLTESERSGQP